MSFPLRRVHLLLKNTRAMSSAKLVDVKVNDKTGVARVSMQRAPVNSLNLDLVTDLLTTLKELEKNRTRGMILTSSLSTIFCSGLDITEFLMKTSTKDRLTQFWTAIQDAWLTLYGSSFPTVAVINGHSPAGGCLLACSCEYRVMVSGKYFIGLSEVKVGIALNRWIMDSMHGVLPTRQTELAVTTGKLFTVDEALNVGLIDEKASDKDDAILRAENWLSSQSKINYKARSLTKQIFRQEKLKRLEENRELDLQLLLATIELSEVQCELESYIKSLKKKP